MLIIGMVLNQSAVACKCCTFFLAEVRFSLHTGMLRELELRNMPLAVWVSKELTKGRPATALQQYGLLMMHAAHRPYSRHSAWRLDVFADVLQNKR